MSALHLPAAEPAVTRTRLVTATHVGKHVCLVWQFKQRFLTHTLRAAQTIVVGDATVVSNSPHGL